MQFSERVALGIQLCCYVFQLADLAGTRVDYLAATLQCGIVLTDCMLHRLRVLFRSSIFCRFVVLFWGVSGQYVLTWKTYSPVLSATARSQTDGVDVSVLE